jgi:hypothetical protein
MKTPDDNRERQNLNKIYRRQTLNERVESKKNGERA